MFVVNMVSGSVKKDFMGYNKESDAIACAESWGWEMPDYNGFVWDLEIEEIDGNADDYYIPEVME